MTDEKKKSILDNPLALIGTMVLLVSTGWGVMLVHIEHKGDERWVQTSNYLPDQERLEELSDLVQESARQNAIAARKITETAEKANALMGKLETIDERLDERTNNFQDRMSAQERQTAILTDDIEDHAARTDAHLTFAELSSLFAPRSELQTNNQSAASQLGNIETRVNALEKHVDSEAAHTRETLRSHGLKIDNINQILNRRQNYEYNPQYNSQ